MYSQLEEFYRSNRSKLISSIRKKAGNVVDAEDVVEETFSRALKHWHHYDVSKPLEGWIVGIMHNALADFKREERMHGMPGLDEPVYDIEERHEVKELVRSALELASDRDKDIVRLYYSVGYTSKEIADIKAISPTIVRHVVSRFAKNIKDKWHKVSTI